MSKVSERQAWCIPVRQFPLRRLSVIFFLRVGCKLTPTRTLFTRLLTVTGSHSIQLTCTDAPADLKNEKKHYRFLHFATVFATWGAAIVKTRLQSPLTSRVTNVRLFYDPLKHQSLTRVSSPLIKNHADRSTRRHVLLSRQC